MPVYNLLAAHKIKVPQLYATGSISGARYAIMEKLAGTTQVPQPVVAEELGKLHSITREYQGWVAMEKPYKKNWEDAFFTVLREQILTCTEKNPRITQLLPQLNNFLGIHERNWKNPERFVLSHTDGFQGMSIEDERGVTFSGVIDLEDHEFTDQRLPLAGYELLENLWGKRTVSSEFWKIYKEHTPVDESYQVTRPLFQLFYLTNWLPAYYQRTDRDMAERIADTEKLIEKLTDSKTLTQS